MSQMQDSSITNDDILSKFNQFYKSLEMSEQLWAIDQIPLYGITGGPLAVIQCYQYFNENLNIGEIEIVESLHASISREIIKPVLKPEDRFKYVSPLTIKCFTLNVPGKWIHLLHRMSKMIKNSFQQLNAFEKVNELIKESNYYSNICAAHIIAGLCEAGATIPNVIIKQLIDNIPIFELCYTTVFNSIFSSSSSSYANNIIEHLLQNNPPEGPLLQASLSVRSQIPESLKSWMISLFENPNLSTEIICAIAKNKNRLIQQNILSELQVMQIVWSSNLFTPRYFDIIFEYFQKALPFLKENDSFSFLKRICQSENHHATELCFIFLKNAKMKQSIQFIVNFLSSPRKTYSQLQEFIKYFDKIVNNVSNEQANTLTKAMLHHLTCEVIIGHIVTKDGTKILGEFNLKKVKKNTHMVVKGWREMSQMINAISHSPSKDILNEEGISIIEKALSVHSNPLIPSIVTFLNSLEIDTIYGFFKRLLNGGSPKQIILIELVSKTLKMFDFNSFSKTIGFHIANLAYSDSPVNVRVSVLKLFPKIYSCFGNEFVNSKFNIAAVTVYQKIKNQTEYLSENEYLREVLDSLEIVYSEMSKNLNDSEIGHFDIPDINNEQTIREVPSVRKKVNKRSKSIGIKLKPSTVIKPVPSRSRISKGKTIKKVGKCI